MIRKTTLSILLCGLCATSQGNAFTLLFGHKYRLPNNHIDFYVDLPNVATDGTSFNVGFARAALEWQSQTRITIDVINQYIDPCTQTTPQQGLLGGLDGLSSVDITPDICGVDFFGPLAALALPTGFRWPTEADPYPIGDINEGDIFYNSAKEWDIYGGPARHEAVDFQRVSVHEIGHVLGLGHSVFTSTVMYESVNDTTTAMPDDLCGIAISYGVPEDCSLLLDDSVTLSGKSTDALFTGGASTDHGLSFEAEFLSTNSIDVITTVVVEDAHIGEEGRLHVVVMLEDGSLFAKDVEGGFNLLSEATMPLPTAELKTLDVANEHLIFQDLVAADLGITDIELLVFVAYSIEADPSELYYSSTPIRVSITE